ncbi:MAG: aromatic ring-hydroxylating dioxygenase subunit alpha [Proteobacteria bacterium]|nr:aromatic ring-hydroxylating dioxygenase subunit alpha [Pseudomonadota bacterium]
MTKSRAKPVTRRYGGYLATYDVAEDAELTHVGRGTPCGEYLRRAWQPAALSRELGELPLNVRMLGEDLVLFRTRRGAVGLLGRHCSHRGASLEYGVPTEEGLVCCYHGWHFAPDGTILETPNDPESQQRRKLCHPAYPTQEYNGIIFAYMGPPDAVPAFAILDSYRQPDTEMVPFTLHFPCNWLQVLENCQDPIHSCFLHTRVSGAQFAQSWGELPELEYVETPIGMINVNVRRWKDKVWIRTTDVMFPNMNQTGALWLTAEEDATFLRSSLTRWMRPEDDTSTRVIGWRYFNRATDPDAKGDKGQVGLGTIDFVGQTEDERPYAERQRIPGDFEAIVSQRPIAIHGMENLNRSDRGVIMLRKLLRQNIHAATEGRPCKALDGGNAIVNTYTQDTVVTIPEGNGDDRALRRRAGEHVGRLVIDTGELPFEQRLAGFMAQLPRALAQARE